MINGSVIINGISDHDMVIVFGLKEHHEGKFQFNPQQMQPQQQQGGPHKILYNNVTLSWLNSEGFQVVMDLLHRLSPETRCHHHEGHSEL